MSYKKELVKSEFKPARIKQRTSFKAFLKTKKSSKKYKLNTLNTTCSICFKEFQNKYKLISHVKSFHNFELNCELKNTESVNIKTETCETCKICEKVFKTKYSLMSHVRICHKF